MKNKEQFFIFILVIILAFLMRIAQPYYEENITEIDSYNFATYSKWIIDNDDIPKEQINSFPQKVNNLPMVFPLLITLISFASGIEILTLYKWIAPFLFVIGLGILYVLVKEITNKKTALLTISFMAILHSTLSRTVVGVPENLIYIFIPLVFYLLVKYTKGGGYPYLLFSSLLITIAIYAHLSALFLIPSFMVAFIYRFFKTTKKEKSKEFLFLIISIFIFLLSLFILYPSLFTVLKFQLENSTKETINFVYLTLYDYILLMGIPLFIFGLLGVFNNPINDSKIIITIYIIIIFIFSWALPNLGVLSHNPARFVPYISIGMVFFSAIFLINFSKINKKICLICILLFFVILVQDPYISKWELTNDLEIEGFKELSTIEENSLIITQPANWHQIRFYSNKYVYSGADIKTKNNLKNVLTNNNLDDLTKEIKQIEKENNKVVYIVISKYKSNYKHPLDGWWNSITYNKEIDIRKFENEDFFQKTFENEEVIAFKLKADIIYSTNN